MRQKTQRILWLDSGAGCVVGLVMLTLRPWLADLYGFESELVLFLGAANLTCAAYSGSLALRASRSGRLPRLAIDALVLANSAWVIACAVMVSVTWPTSHPLGVAQLTLEGVFVGGLALAEYLVVRPEASC